MSGRGLLLIASAALALKNIKMKRLRKIISVFSSWYQDNNLQGMQKFLYLAVAISTKT